MRILGIRVDEVNMAAALQFVAAAIDAYATDGRLRRVVTLNPEGLFLAAQDAAFAQIVDSADLVTADGAGILWAARRLGQPLPERVTGIDLLQQACALAAQRGWRVFLLGAKPGLAAQAAATLCAQYPGLQIAGCYHGYFQDEEAAVLASIRAAEPDILLVALGLPAQERFCAEYQEQLQAAVAIGVGGSFDVLAGQIRRAPLFLRRARLEWLWRLILQPSRLPRLLVIPKFMLAVSREAKTATR